MFHRSVCLRSYISTLKLPRSTLPPRPRAEVQASLLKQCTDDYYAWQSEYRAANPTFILHDGPPYANGDLHIGHALNKILKDVFNRYQCSQGKRIAFRPGWDCHGLPIELKALQDSGKASGGHGHELLEPTAIRDAARKLAAGTVEKQKQGFKSWAVMGDWDNAYLTMDPEFELNQLDVFKTIVSKGLVFRQYKPVYWSPSTSTALAEAELEYDDHHSSTAAFVKLEMVAKDIPSTSKAFGKVYALIWTTTPWTIPANEAIAFHSNMQYTTIQDGNDLLVVSMSRVEAVCEATGLLYDREATAKCSFNGSLLSDSRYIHPLREHGSPAQVFLHADFVTSDTGTGLVHMAPGHGHDDYNICRALNMSVSAPVDDQGRFTKDAYPTRPEVLSGKFVLEEGTSAVLDLLQEQSLLLHRHEFVHRYPIDWRTKRPVIIRATAQWFANVDKIKNSALSALNNVQFVPVTGRQRLEKFVAGRGDWCISRQRAWGVPIPALYRHEGTSIAPVMTAESIEHIIRVIRDRGIDSWWTDEPDDPAWVAASLPEGRYSRGMDTMDVWFDSGSTWTQLENALGPGPPANVYLEGTDQHRGWFQSSLLTRVACLSAETPPQRLAPFQILLTHGFTLDQNGRKMSKSVGNVISPREIIQGTLLPPLTAKKKSRKSGSSSNTQPRYDALGPDVLRLWVASNDYSSDISVGQPVMQAITASLHKYRVTLKWLLGVLDDLPAEPSTNTTPVISDRIAMLHLARLTDKFQAAYEDFEPYKAMRALDRYVANDLSSFYIEYAKDILYTAPLGSRHRVQMVCYDIFQHLLAMLMPAIPLLVAEVMQHASSPLRQTLSARGHDPFRRIWSPISEHDLNPTGCLASADEERAVVVLRNAVRELQERVRKEGLIGSGLECQVITVLNTRDSSSTELQTLASIPAAELEGALVVSRHTCLDHVGVDDGDTDAIRGNPIIIGGEGCGRAIATKVASARELPWLAVQRIGEFGNAQTSQHDALVLLGPLPDQTKCPRCWRHAVQKQQVLLQENAICRRCQSALEGAVD